MEILSFCGLILLLIAQWVFFSITVNKLVNKLMSRSYVDYQQGNVIAKDVQEPPVKLMPVDPLEFEDLRAI